MIGLDTNVLLRYLVQDDARQFARARRLIESGSTADDPAWISLIVTAELVWALRTHYGFARGQIAEVIERLLNAAEVRFEREHLVDEAVAIYRGGRADLADALIVLVNRENGCEATASFDRKLVEAQLAVEP